MKVKAIVFDFDGVLADSFEHLYGLNKEAMAKIGIKLSKIMYRDFFIDNYHSGVRKFIKSDAAYGKFSEFRHQNFGKYYSAVKLFPGMPGFVEKISRAFALAVVSSGESRWINKLFAGAKIKGCFYFVGAGDNQDKRKQINLALERLKISPQEAAMVSDTCGDLELAKKLGLKAIGVSWGFHSPKELRLINPDFIARNLPQLYSYLSP
ncbi:MAG: HAD family hydrolase [Patescibacteria group bacterium]